MLRDPGNSMTVRQELASDAKTPAAGLAKGADGRPVTDQDRAQHELREAEEKFRSLAQRWGSGGSGSTAATCR